VKLRKYDWGMGICQVQNDMYLFVIVLQSLWFTFMHGKPRGIKIDKHFKPNIQYCFMVDIEYQTVKLLE